MATWFTITFEGEPTERDFERVAELAAQGCTSGQLLNDPEDCEREGPATGYYLPSGLGTSSDDAETAWTLPFRRRPADPGAGG